MGSVLIRTWFLCMGDQEGAGYGHERNGSDSCVNFAAVTIT